jgi:hypothetical protein
LALSDRPAGTAGDRRRLTVETKAGDHMKLKHGR